MREKEIEKMLVNAVKIHGGLALKFVSPNFNGMPDRLILLPFGKIAFAEMKAPGRRPRLRQRAVIRALYRCGCRVAVIDNLKSAEGFVRRLAK